MSGSARAWTIAPVMRIGSAARVGLVLALATGCAPAATPPPATQSDAWSRLIAEADSIGPETPQVAPGPSAVCGGGVIRPDSLEVAAPADDLLLATRSLRTRGNFTYPELPSTGAGRFAVRDVLCKPEEGHPYIFVLEREHRYFYVILSLRDYPAYGSLRFRTTDGRWRRFGWDPDLRTFAPLEGAADGS